MYCHIVKVILGKGREQGHSIVPVYAQGEFTWTVAETDTEYTAYHATSIPAGSMVVCHFKYGPVLARVVSTCEAHSVELKGPFEAPMIIDVVALDDYIKAEEQRAVRAGISLHLEVALLGCIKGGSNSYFKWRLNPDTGLFERTRLVLRGKTYIAEWAKAEPADLRVILNGSCVARTVARTVAKDYDSFIFAMTHNEEVCDNLVASLCDKAMRVRHV